MNYVITVYRTTGNQVQRFNADSLAKALQVYQLRCGERFVHKVEMSVILETWVNIINH